MIYDRKLLLHQEERAFGSVPRITVNPSRQLRSGAAVRSFILHVSLYADKDQRGTVQNGHR